MGIAFGSTHSYELLLPVIPAKAGMTGLQSAVKGA